MPAASSSRRLNQLLEAASHPPLDEEIAGKFAAYLTLLQKWNAKTNLTAIRDEEGILSRHFLESILCANHIPENVYNLLDFGSGAGFPGIPIALMRNDLSVTLAESQHKKAAFLREAVRTLEITAKVHSGRAEDLPSLFDCVTLRAVDHMEKALPASLALLAPGGSLAVMTTLPEADRVQFLASQLTWQAPQPMPPGTDRILLIGQRS